MTTKELLDYTKRFMRTTHTSEESICDGSMLFYALRDHDHRGVELLLRCGTDAKEEVGEYSALDVAAIFNNVRGAELLVRHDATPDYTTLLFHACIHDHYSFAKWCIDHGADVTARLYDDPLLHYAIDHWCGDYSFFDCDQEVIDDIKRKQLNTNKKVRAYGDYTVAYLLVLHGANPHAIDDNHNKSYLDNISDPYVRSLLEQVSKTVRTRHATAFLCANIAASLE